MTVMNPAMRGGVMFQQQTPNSNAMIARMLMQRGNINTPLEGVGRLAQQAAFQMREKRDQEEQSTALQEALQGVTGGYQPSTGITWNSGRPGDKTEQLVQGLLKNKHTAPMGAQLAMAQILKGEAPTAQDLTPEDIAKLGLPEGTVAQRGPDGSVKIIHKPEATKRERVPDVNGRLRYVDDGSLVFPNVEKDVEPVSPMTAVGKLNADLKAGLISPEEHAAAVKKATTSDPLVNIGPTETEFQKAMGKNLASKYQDYTTAAESAAETLSALEAFETSMEGFETGSFADTREMMGSMARLMGIDQETLPKIIGNPGDAEAARAAANKLALRARTSGGGMPGQMSDKDVQFLSQSVVNLANTPGGNERIAEMMREVAVRAIKKKEMADEYLETNPDLRGFDKQWREYVQDNPLFTGKVPEFYKTIDFKGMSEKDLLEVDPKSLSTEQLSEYLKVLENG